MKGRGLGLYSLISLRRFSGWGFGPYGCLGDGL